ncbi:competence protein CoiA [Ornithinibacillus salinisoli]|uniref:Competence protein CoiA n=1 Tax=Ornithinibacillus salinisoli TaxID=1848459 RepID=A0ABW4W3L1_9BACI
MLQAKSQLGIVTMLYTLSRSEIQELKKTKRFYCPTCNEEVIIKAGTQIMPHFAHRSKVNCPANEGGEGAYHEKGKLLLYHWLNKQGYNVLLEPYISSINQRPDILLMINAKKIAIEFQCARIPIDQVHKRNEGYRKANISPLWIIGANRFQRNGKKHLQVDQFTLQFLHQFNSTHQRYLYYFDPTTNLLITAQDMYETRKSKVLSNFRFLKLDQIRFRNIFQYDAFTRVELMSHWENEKKRFRVQRRIRPRGKELAWYQWLYAKGQYIDNLPSIIYLPVASQFLMKSQPWDWQSRLVMEILEPLSTGKQFSIGNCSHLLKNHYFPRINYPLFHSIESPINQYLQLLCHLNLIKPVSNLQYQKVREIHFYNHLEEAIKGDKQLLYQLI